MFPPKMSLDLEMETVSVAYRKSEETIQSEADSTTGPEIRTSSNRGIAQQICNQNQGLGLESLSRERKRKALDDTDQDQNGGGIKRIKSVENCPGKEGSQSMNVDVFGAGSNAFVNSNIPGPITIQQSMMLPRFVRSQKLLEAHRMMLQSFKNLEQGTLQADERYRQVEHELKEYVANTMNGGEEDDYIVQRLNILTELNKEKASLRQQMNIAADVMKAYLRELDF